MSRPVRLVLMLIAVQLSGCTGMVEIINEQGNPYYYHPGFGVIILGSAGESRLWAVQGQTRQGKTNFEIIPELSKRLDVFAWKVEIGEKFRLLGVAMSPGLEKAFSGSHTITVEQEGIYYYGTILSKEAHILLIKKAPAELISVANEKYPYVFNALDPMNFQ